LCITDRLGNISNENIELVSSEMKSGEWTNTFLRTLNIAIREKRVVICTPVVATGHSIDEHVHAMFAFLHKNAITHKEEVQLLHRVRVSNTYDGSIVGFVENGKGGRCECRQSKQLTIHENNIHPQVKLAAAEMMSEMADTVNRHYWLFWKDEEFRMKPMKMRYSTEEIKDDTDVYRNNLNVVKGTMLAFVNGGENYNALGELNQQRLRNIDLKYGEKSSEFKRMWCKAYPEDVSFDLEKLTPLARYLRLLTEGT